MSIPVGVTGTASLRRMATKLKTAEAIVKAEAAKELQRAAPPVLAAVRAEVRTASFPAVPSKGSGRESSGLREHLADSTVTRPFGTGVRFVVADPRGQTLARYTEGVAYHTRWRHPVFGNVERWVQQKADPWFFPTIRAARGTFEGAIERAIRRIAQRLS